MFNQKIIKCLNLASKILNGVLLAEENLKEALKDADTIQHKTFAKLSSSSVLVQSNLNWDLHYNHCKSHPPTHPGQVYLSHF